MEIEVIITRDGMLTVLARGNGTFTEATEQLQAVLQQLTDAAIPLEQVSAVERHRHADTEDTIIHTRRRTRHT